MSKFSKKSSSSRRLVNNRLVEKELSILRCMLPMVNSKPATSKLVVINEAIKYIDQLEQQILLKWTMQQRLMNQRTVNEQRQIQQLVISQTKLKKTQPKTIARKWCHIEFKLCSYFVNMFNMWIRRRWPSWTYLSVNNSRVLEFANFLSFSSLMVVCVLQNLISHIVRIWISHCQAAVQLCVNRVHLEWNFIKFSSVYDVTWSPNFVQNSPYETDL